MDHQDCGHGWWYSRSLHEQDLEVCAFHGRRRRINTDFGMIEVSGRGFGFQVAAARIYARYFGVSDAKSTGTAWTRICTYRLGDSM
jgi:hypothetical protein